VEPTQDTRRSRDDGIWALIAALVAAVAAIELHSPLAIDIRSLGNLLLACLALGAAALFYSRFRPNENLRASCVCLTQALLFSAGGAILSYLLARNGGPFWDSTLYAWDQGLGLDWLGYVHLVDAHPWLVLPFHLAYGSLIPQIIVVILALGFSGRLDQLRTFVFAAISSGIAAIVISAFVPAVSNYVHLGLTQADFRHVNPWAGYVHLHDLTALRNGMMTELSLPKMQGIITFPSYHACLATLTLWAFWKSGLGWFRWVGAAVALTTIAATPVDGGHYFVDVIAGIAIALASILAARKLIYARVPLGALTAWPFRRSREAFAR
jgi:hypothetical protein